MTELARALEVDRSTVSARIERLTRDGVIEAFTVRLANEVDADALQGVTTIKLAPNASRAAVRTIRGLPEIERLHTTIGAWDLIAHLRAADLGTFDEAIERIRAVPGVLDTQTSLLFNSLTTRRD
ncbi:Lrp/AsnC family transcriptional regulator [Amnibacterium setariae]|uniref:Lrp/AsnC family transcriptional regulator n=1 Tax=Amnibacterium setariae TaxID=2306585 RepID=UPI0018F3AE3D|nr:Lrp/AsnC family transcriptional regulator [Amnibacterium setariae]